MDTFSRRSKSLADKFTELKADQLLKKQLEYWQTQKQERQHKILLQREQDNQ